MPETAKAHYAKAAKAILAKAQKEHRSLTPAEKKTAEDHLERIREIRASEAWQEGRTEDIPADLLELKQRRQADAAEIQGQIDSLHSGSPVEDAGGRRDAVAASWARELSGSIGPDGKIIQGAVTVPSPLTAPPSSDPISIQSPPTSAVELFPVKRTEASEESVMQQTVRTNAAAPVAHGAAKPESVLTLTRTAVPIATVAHLVSDVNNQDLSDSNRLGQFIRSELLLGLRLAVEGQLLNGTGTAPAIRGVLNTTGIQTQAFIAGDLLATLRRGRRLLEEKGFTPSAVVIDAASAETIDTARASDGHFLFKGPQDAGPGRVWGVPVVVSNALPVNTALMGDFAQALVFARQNATVDVDPLSGFATNRTRFRAEQRLGLGVLRPAGFVKITLA